MSSVRWVVVVTIVSLAACASPAMPAPRIRAEGAWSRPVASISDGTHPSEMPMDGSGAVGVVYLTLINEGPAADRLIGAQTDVAATVELHQTTLNNGIAHMQPVSGIDVPAGGRVAIQPGGYHLMLIGLKRALKIGDRFEIALQFQKSGQLIVEVEVRQP